MSESARQLVLLLVALPFFGYGMYTDVRNRRISNRLNLILSAVGVSAQAALWGGAGAFQGALGLLVGLGVTLPFYAMGAIGAGDAKFMAAIGACLGPWGAGYALVAGVLVAAAFAVLEIARSDHREVYYANLYLIASKLVSLRVLNSATAPYSQLNENRTSMPYGVFLGIGGLAVLSGRALGWGI